MPASMAFCWRISPSIHWTWRWVSLRGMLLLTHNVYWGSEGLWVLPLLMKSPRFRHLKGHTADIRGSPSALEWNGCSNHYSNTSSSICRWDPGLCGRRLGQYWKESWGEFSLAPSFDPFSRLRSATWRLAPEDYLGPAFYQGTLEAGPSPKDTFLDLSVSKPPYSLMS